MDREIKFRAWDKDDKDRINTDNLMLTFEGFMLQTENMMYPGNYIIMQYTGLKDKNGKEIYEGDIILFGNKEDNNHINSCYHQKCYEIVFHKGKFQKKIKNYMFDIIGEIEIIGNIYENPDFIHQ